MSDLPMGGVLGIDPGSASGAIAYVADPEIVGLLGMPRAYAWPIKKLTEREIWNRVYELAQLARFGVLELVHAMPKQGVASTFKFGVSFGALQMALVAAQTPFQKVTPAQWQGAMKCRTGGDKKITRAAAQRLFPDLEITDQTADALLIAEYGRLHL